MHLEVPLPEVASPWPCNLRRFLAYARILHVLVYHLDCDNMQAIRVYSCKLSSNRYTVDGQVALPVFLVQGWRKECFLKGRGSQSKNEDGKTKKRHNLL